MFVNTFFTSMQFDEEDQGTAAWDWNWNGNGQPYFNGNRIEMTKIAIDALHMEQDGNSPDYDSWTGTVPNTWGWKTLVNAQFNGNLTAGSAPLSEDFVSEVRIKRRVKGEFKWSTIYAYPIKTRQDFAFEFYDKTAASDTVYEYAYVPVINGTEGPMGYIEVESSFKDYFLIGVDHTYHLVVNTENDITYNQETATQTTIGRKYPFVIKNGNVGFYSGTLTATVLNYHECEFDYEHSLAFRKEFDQFLTDGKVKILKDWQGHVWLVSIVDAIPQNTGEHLWLPKHQISWVECGNAADYGDLYDGGFYDIDWDRY